jgi:indolepyruvate ferredoxin oxidoreductase beta subunit
MKAFNIYITGVGGQGIGLLSQTILRGADHAGLDVMAVDTHGLAQRGGAVVSRIRCGSKVFSPLTLSHHCDLVLGMEIHEALRGLEVALKKGGTLVYMDHAWQPLPVRLGQCQEITPEDISRACSQKDARPLPVETSGLADPRTQNMALVGTVARYALIPGILKKDYAKALEDLLTGDSLAHNQDVFDHYARQG